MRTCIALCGVLGLVGAAPAAAAEAPARIVQTQRSGMAVAMVVHAVTGRPLEGMPVVVDDAGDGFTYEVFKTDKLGLAILKPLPAGIYIAYVSYNNHISAPVVFRIDDENDVSRAPTFTLTFNPEADPG